MYQPGDLNRSTFAVGSPDENGWEEDAMPSYDMRNSDTTPQHPCCWLPHSCGEWVIGGPEQARALVADLQAWLDALPVAS